MYLMTDVCKIELEKLLQNTNWELGRLFSLLTMGWLRFSIIFIFTNLLIISHTR